MKDAAVMNDVNWLIDRSSVADENGWFLLLSASLTNHGLAEDLPDLKGEALALKGHLCLYWFVGGYGPRTSIPPTVSACGIVLTARMLATEAQLIA